MARTICVNAPVGLILVAGVITAFADSGTYESIGNFTPAFTKLEFPGQAITGGSLQGATTIIRSSGGIFDEGAHALFECVIYAKKSDAGMDLESPCILTDKSGDKLYYMSKRKAGDMNAGGDGRQDYVGGTGKFAGISGGCSYRTDYVSPTQAVSIQKCEWKKP